MKPKNLLEAVQRTVGRYPDKSALMWKKDGKYRSMTYREMWQQVQDAAAGLARLGIGKDDKVALMSENNPWWPITDLAILSLGAVTVPVYPTVTPEQVAHILKNAECKAIVVEDEHQLKKVREAEAEVSSIVVIRPGDGFTPGEGILDMAGLLKEGQSHPLEGWEKGLGEIGRDRLATIIHTSGTTGPPKGVMLTHGNFLANMEGVHFWVIELKPEDVLLSYLPLSHVFERMAGQFMPLYVGTTIAYAESIDAIQENLQEVKPTVMTSVPRLFEKVYEKVQEQIESGTPLRRKIFDWAVRIGMQRYEIYLNKSIDQLLLGDPMPPGLRRQWKLARALVYKKVKEGLGGRIRGMVSGGAPLNPEIGKFFWAVDVPILEGYGLTETSPVIAANPMVRSKVGTVGKPLPNVEVKIAPDGEILVRGPSVMVGYYKNEAATREAISEDGWFHTGDLGELDEEGYLKVVDRKKNILVLSTGKNVAPQPVETAINESRYIEISALVGNNRKYVIVLVVPEFENLLAWAKKKGIEGGRAEVVRHPEVQRLIREEVERAVQEFAPHEQPKKVVIMDKEWSVETGELTPTLKVRMREIEKKYAEQIEKAYADNAGAASEVAAAAD